MKVLGVQLGGTLALALAGAVLAPADARWVVAVVAATLGALVLLPPIRRIQSYVWAPVLGATVVIASSALSSSLQTRPLLDALVAHLHVPLLILALAYSSISLDESGVFNWCSLSIMRLGGGDGRRLLVAVFVGVSVVTFFTSNDIVILSMTPILVHLARHAEIRNLTPFLVAQFVAANTASMGLYIGNPTNIVIGSAAGLGFLEYARRMLVPTVIATSTALLLIWLIFGRLRHVNRVSAAYRLSPDVAPWTWTMTSKASLFALFLLSLGLLGHPRVAGALLDGADAAAVRRSVALVIVVTSVAFAALFAVFDLLSDRRRAQAGARARLRRMPFEIVPFFLAFSVLLSGMESAGLAELAAVGVEDAFRRGPVAGALTTGFYGIASVNVLNNLPASLLFERLWLGGAAGLEARLAVIDPRAPDIFVDASLFASNFGANLTLIGALAGLMWLRIVREAGEGPAAPRVPDAKTLLGYGIILVPIVTVVTCGGIALVRLAGG